MDVDWLLCKCVQVVDPLVYEEFWWLLVIMVTEECIFSEMCGNIFGLIVFTQMSFDATALHNHKNRQGCSRPKEIANNLHK